MAPKLSSLKAMLPVMALLALLLLSACDKSDQDRHVGYYSEAGKVYDETGAAIQLRGINMFGFDSGILIPQYLDKMGWKEQIAQVKALGFNAVRLPFVPETLYSPLRIGDSLDTYVDPVLNADLAGKTPLEVLDLWMAEADRQGLYVLLDFHSISKGVRVAQWFTDDPDVYAVNGSAPTYNHQAYTDLDWMRDLQFVAKRYANNPHLLGIDLYNEPHGLVRWGFGGDPNYDWKLAVEAAGKALLETNPRILLFVQGIFHNNDGVEVADIAVNYGENLQPQAYKPLDLPKDKLVLAPHTYGPDVSSKPSFNSANFPDNLAADWETLFGQFQSAAPIKGEFTVVIGEFGGYYGNGPSGVKDAIWHEALVDYLINKDMRSAFYWCYTPNSADTGGILNEDLTVREDKMAMLRRLFGS